MPADSETIEVRPDEAFDIGRLRTHLSGKLPGTGEELRVRQFGGGHANLTYLLDFGHVEYVLRRPPLGPVAPGAHDMKREYLVLSRLWQAFPPAPRAYHLCEDEQVIGSQFFVMERRHGIVVRNRVPDVLGGGTDRVANRKLSEVVVNTLAEFHAVDPAACGLGQLGHPDGFLQRQVDGWLQRWQRARHEDNPIAERVASWVAARVPVSPSPSLVHNDWRLDNMAVASDNPATCVAVYDWDMCTRGDPLADLGTLLAVWYEEGEVPATLNPMPTTAPGFMNRAEALALYGTRTQHDLSDFPWYLVFGTWKLGVVLQQIFIRWHRGQTRDDRFADMGGAASRLFELAAERTPH
ncbi:MAG TPA: phosphotransferase family protein [Acidimicrobiia bacterium]|nr:phosphotransferase family protein [Acidimicrobiia bacterium]